MIILFVKNILFTLLVPGIVAVWLPLMITNGLSANEGVLFFFAVDLMFIGLVIYSQCVWDFMVKGDGTPAPINAPKNLVISGFYCYTRNPLYIAVLCFIMGWVWLYFDWPILLYGLSVFGCFQLFVVYYEEPILLQLFGSEYKNYKKSVNRWIGVCKK